MLKENDIGALFATMQAAYGHSWAHKADAVPMWLRALGGFDRPAILRAAEKAIKTYTDYPPSLGQFCSMVEYTQPQLPSSDAHDNAALAERVYAYTMPYDGIKNPKGNPHHVKLPESIGQRQHGESARQYEIRIANEITLTMYPQLRARQ